MTKKEIRTEVETLVKRMLNNDYTSIEDFWEFNNKTELEDIQKAFSKDKFYFKEYLRLFITENG